MAARRHAYLAWRVGAVWRIAFGATCLNAVGFYLILSYMPTYLITEMGMGQTESFIAVSISLVAYIFFIILMGSLPGSVANSS